MNSVSRYKKRQYMLHELKNTITMESDVDQNIVNELLYSKVDTSLINKTTQIIESHYKFEYDFNVSAEEAKEFLDKFKKDFNQAKFDKLINDCKKDVINSIVTPFGLGKIVAAYDKVGGNVDTVHNVRSGVYVTENEQDNYNNRGEYNSDEYHKDPDFIAINRKHSEDRKNGTAIDYMTGEILNPHESHHLDHKKSAKEIHDDAGRILAEIDGPSLANTNTNLDPTTATNNTSKKADPMEVFLARKNEAIKKIGELKSKGNLSDKEQRELEKLEKLKSIDDQKALEADKKAREAIDEEINKKYYTSEKFVTNTLKTGANEGAKMGTQQAIGLIMTEFFTAVFDEILDIYRNGFSAGFDDDRFFSVLKERLHNIAQKLKAKWKDVAIAFKDGFLSGFISNLVTTAINMFVTTGKRLVRIIREGIFSLFRAVKLLLFPPKNMTFEEAMHEAKKLIATGLIVSLGVMLEESVAAFIKSTAILAPFADTLSAVFVGAITGLAITMTVYYIDKKKNDKDAMQELIEQTDKKFDSAEQLLKQLAY